MQKSKILFSLILLIVIVNIIFAYYGYQIFRVETESTLRRQDSYSLSVMNLISKRLDSIFSDTEGIVRNEFTQREDSVVSQADMEKLKSSLPMITKVYVLPYEGGRTGIALIDRCVSDHKAKNMAREWVRYFRMDSSEKAKALSIVYFRDKKHFIVIDYNVEEFVAFTRSYIKEIAGTIGTYIEVTDKYGKLLAGSEKLEKAKRPPTKELKSIFTYWRVGVKDKTLEDVELSRKNKVKIYIEILIFLSVIMVGTLYIAMIMVVNESAVVRLRSDFVSTVSHDLKTPLTSIKMYSELLKGGKVKDKKKLKSYLNTIVTETERLAFLINNVLEFSRREYRLRQRASSPVDLAKVVTHAAQIVKPFAARSGYKVKLELKEIPLIPGDDVGLNHLVMNLIDNAIKYSPKNKTILVKLAREGRLVRLSVSDKGIGIPEEERQAIFEKFYRSSDPFVRTKKGIGIGLSIVKQIALDHRARIELESKKGKGSTFSVLFNPGRLI